MCVCCLCMFVAHERLRKKARINFIHSAFQYFVKQKYKVVKVVTNDISLDLLIGTSNKKKENKNNFVSYIVSFRSGYGRFVIIQIVSSDYASNLSGALCFRVV